MQRRVSHQMPRQVARHFFLRRWMRPWMRRCRWPWRLTLALVLVLAAGTVGCGTRSASVAPPGSGAASAQVQPPAPVTGARRENGAKAEREPSRPPAPPAANPAPDATSELIASLEQEFAAARRLYDAGQMDEARTGFDRTLDRLLESNLSIRQSPRLQAELNSLIDRTQALESDVMQSGGLTNAQAQATPLDRIPQLTFPLSAATRKQIEAEVQAAMARAAAQGRQGTLPLVMNDAVLRYIHYFTTRGRSDFIAGYRRGGRYHAMVDRIFQKVGVPGELFYLAQLESGFNPRSVSPVGARGMWQLMSSLASGYGLKRTHWVDQRYNPELSTRAAARHLRDLHTEFGDWYLAMAAYVAGPLPVEKAVADTGLADFWKLCDRGALNSVVQNYVPIILAIALISQSPEEYGFQHLQPDPPEKVDRVELEHGVDLRLAAECAGVTLHDLQFLNPSLLHYLAPAGFDLKLPQGTRAHFEEGLKVVPAGDRIKWRVHWVHRGETWNQLARRYRIRLARLTRANHAKAERPPVPGTPVALPY